MAEEPRTVWRGGGGERVERAVNCFGKFSQNASCVLLAAPFSSSATSKHNSTLCSVSLRLLPTVFSCTLCNVLQTDLTGWMWTIKYLLLEHYPLGDHNPGTWSLGGSPGKKKMPNEMKEGVQRVHRVTGNKDEAFPLTSKS